MVGWGMGGWGSGGSFVYCTKERQLEECQDDRKIGGIRDKTIREIVDRKNKGMNDRTIGEMDE